MLKGWFKVKAQGKSSFTVLFMMLALVVALSVVPSAALAAPNPVPVGHLGSVALETNNGIVTQGKVKVTGDSSIYGTVVWSTYGKASAEATPEVGTSFSTLADVYTYNLNGNPFVPAAAGDTISMVEVNLSGEVVGYKSLVVGANHVGTVAPMVDRNYVFPGLTVGNNQFVQGANFYNSPSGVTVSNITSSNPAIATINNQGYYYFFLQGSSKGTATISFDVADSLTGDKIRIIMPVSVVSNREPYLNNEDYHFTGRDLTLTVNPPTEDWVPDSIEVNGVTVPSESYTYTPPGVFGQENGQMVLQAGVLLEGENKIVVKSYDTIDGVYEITLHQSEHSYYMSEPLIDRASGGLTASVKFVRYITNNSYNDQATVIFQLMNGDVPVDTVSVTTDRLDSYQTNRAHFNLADAATNPNYSVRVFLITGDNADPSNLGYNLVTEVDATEFEQRYQEWRNWD